jgi:hypothetical protein
MSRARHKLTGIRHNAINNSAKTYQEETGTNGTDIVDVEGDGWGTGGADGDSVIFKTSGGPFNTDDGSVPYGEPSNMYNTLRLAVGSHFQGNFYDRKRISRVLWNCNLFSGENNPLNSNTVIKNSVLTIVISGGEGADDGLGGPSNYMNTKLCNIYRNRQTLPDDIDVTYSWWENWGPLEGDTWGTGGASNTTTDIDTSVSSSYYLRPMVSSNNDGGERWSVYDRIEIDFTQLVQDAVTNRNGLLKTIWIKENDDGEDIYEDLANESIFFSCNSSNLSHRPELIIDWHNP